MTLHVDFQSFYREMFGVTEFEYEELNDKGTAAHVEDTGGTGEEFYIHECEESTKKLNETFPYSTYVIASYAKTGNIVAYDAMVKREDGTFFSSTVVFYPFTGMVNIGFKCTDSRSLELYSINEKEVKKFGSSLGDVASFMIREMLATNPKCRLHFATNDIKVQTVFGIPIPGYVE